MKKDFIVYGQEQRDIVAAGISAVAAVLLEGSEESKRSLLLCLDYYLDPYYGCLHPDSDGIFILLQQCLLTEPSSEVRADIMQLLSDYCDCPLRCVAAASARRSQRVEGRCITPVGRTLRPACAETFDVGQIGSFCSGNLDV